MSVKRERWAKKRKIINWKNDLENKQSQRIKSDLQLFLVKDFIILSLQLILRVHKNPDVMNLIEYF